MVSKNVLPGSIKINEERRFSYFSMKMEKVKSVCSEAISTVNDNISLKGIDGKLRICKFVNHSGKIILLLTISMKFSLGPHITLWLDRESIKIDHLSSWIGKKGVFEMQTISMMKAKNAILLISEGKSENI